MKVANAIKRLQAYDPDDELIIAWWDNDILSEEYKMTKTEWIKICESLDDLTPSINEEMYKQIFIELVQFRKED